MSFVHVLINVNSKIDHCLSSFPPLRCGKSLIILVSQYSPVCLTNAMNYETMLEQEHVLEFVHGLNLEYAKTRTKFLEKIHS